MCLNPPKDAPIWAPATRNTNQEKTVKRFMLVHFGFETPTPAIMADWKRWFESIADRTVENIGFTGGREITRDSTEGLPWDPDSITGWTP